MFKKVLWNTRGSDKIECIQLTKFKGRKVTRQIYILQHHEYIFFFFSNKCEALISPVSPGDQTEVAEQPQVPPSGHALVLPPQREVGEGGVDGGHGLRRRVRGRRGSRGVVVGLGGGGGAGGGRRVVGRQRPRQGGVDVVGGAELGGQPLVLAGGGGGQQVSKDNRRELFDIFGKFSLFGLT